MASRAAAAPPALTEEGVKLLFLDLDGVICCNYHGELEADKLALVGKIVEETGCRVVLSTDWRRQPHLRTRAEETLSGYGVTCIGATPQYPMYARVRPKEILAWMAEYNGPIAAWCALDDRDLVLEEGGAPAFINHFVLTEFATGLTEPLAQRVIDRIGRGDGVSDRSSALSASPADRWKPQPWPPSASGGVLAASAVFLGAASSGSSAPPETAAPDPPPLRSVQALLRESSLWHLEGALRGQSLRSLHERLLSDPEGRIGFLSHLRSLGIARIGERQTLANALSRASRLRRLDWLMSEPIDESSDEEKEGTAALLLHAAGASEAMDEDDEDGAILATGSDDAAHLHGSFYVHQQQHPYEALEGAHSPAAFGPGPMADEVAEAGGSSGGGGGGGGLLSDSGFFMIASGATSAPACVGTANGKLQAAMAAGTLEALNTTLEECSELASPDLVEEARRMREERKLSLMSEPIDEPSGEERKLSLVAARVVLSVPPGPERSVSIPVGAMVGARAAPRSGRLGAVGGLLSVPPHARCSALLLHPHPGRGGDMYNAFIASIFVLLRNRGVATLRFNFSTGDDETDETVAPADAEDDLEALLRCNKAEAQAAVEMLREKMPEGAPVVLVGFSWGAVISLALARDDPQRIQALALVAPPINVLPPGMHPSRGDFARWPILLTAGDADEYCDVGRLRAIAGGAATTCLVLDGVTHFLHGETAQAAALQVDAWVGSLTL